MSYSTERLAYYEKQYEMAKIGFDQMVKTTDENFFETLAPYFNALLELKSSLDFARKDVEKEKGNEK